MAPSHDPQEAARARAATALVRATTAAVRVCGDVLAHQFAAWPPSAGPCAGVVLGPGRNSFDGLHLDPTLHALPDGHRCGVVTFQKAQAILAVEVIAVEGAADDVNAGGATLARALREPTGPGEVMCVVLLAGGAAVVPVTPLTSVGGQA